MSAEFRLSSLVSDSVQTRSDWHLSEGCNLIGTNINTNMAPAALAMFSQIICPRIWLDKNKATISVHISFVYSMTLSLLSPAFLSFHLSAPRVLLVRHQ